MEALTGVPAVVWAVLAGLGIAVLLVLRAAWSARSSATARLPALLIAIAGGLLLMTVVLARPVAAGSLVGLISSHWKAIGVAAAVLLVTLAVVDFAFSRGRALIAWLLGRWATPQSRGVQLLATGVVIAGLVGASLGGVLALPDMPRPVSQGVTLGSPGSPPPSTAPGQAAVDTTAPVESVEVFDLPGGPMDIVLDAERSGYIVLDTRGVLHFNLPAAAGQPLTTRLVADGIEHGRGVALRDGRLYVVDLGSVCAVAGADCDPRISSQQPFDQDVEVATLATTSASVHSFSVASDGSLERGPDVLTDIPVASFAHAANGLTLGPDGELYLPVGGFDWLWSAPQRVTEAQLVHPDWLGTILRFDGSGSQPEVFSHGLRNVYEVAFDPDGKLWAVDNNGPTLGGWLSEELLQLKQGTDYGYPYDGTYGSWTRRDDGPLWTSPHVGSAGLLWSDDAGLGPGLLSGSCGFLTRFALDSRPMWTQDNGRWAQTDLLSKVPGCVTSIVAISGHELLATVYASADSGELYRIKLASDE